MKPQFGAINHWRIADGLVDMVRDRIAEVGVKEAEAATCVELGLTESRDERTGVPVAAVRWRGVDGTNADAVGRRASRPRHRHRPSVIPQG